MVEVYFTRHAESLANTGIRNVDAPLSNTGIEQAKKLSGYFDYIISSPLRRCKETLHYSTIDYKRLIFDENFRERVFDQSDRLLFEPTDLIETDDVFWRRVATFRNNLDKLKKRCKPGEKILLIGHAYFFNAWFRNGCFPGPYNAEIIKLE